MDALKKAEAAKRQGADGAPETNAEPSRISFADMSLEPIIESPPGDELGSPATDASTTVAREAPASLPELPSNLGGLDAEFVAHHEAHKAASGSAVRLKAAQTETASAPTPASTPAPVQKPVVVASESMVQADREAARNMFDAKAPAQPAGNRKFALMIGILSTSVALAIVGYFWWQYQSNFAVSTNNFAVRPAPASTRPAPTTPVTPATTAPTSPATAAATPLLPGAVSQVAAGAGMVAKEAAVDDETESPSGAPTPKAAPPRAGKKTPVEALETSADGDAIRLVRVTKSPLQVNPVLSKAYEDFNRGSFATAKTAYEALIKMEPYNIEALHGLAAIAVVEKRWNAADHYYERILVADPKDAAALSGLINLHGQNNPGAAESRLKGITSEQPDSAAAQFALGNLFASQQRWADAQQAYFKAYSADAENPDILYNLAVSLEHMNQARLARQYYLLALDATKRRPAGFDTAVVGARAAALKSP